MRKQKEIFQIFSTPASSNDVGPLGACAVAVGITCLTALQELYLGCVAGRGGSYFVHFFEETCEIYLPGRNAI
jgi:hypothetical protein